jgi:arylsulfatase A-like enzyme
MSWSSPGVVRGVRLGTAASVLLTGALVLPQQESARAANTRPNVLLLVLDDARTGSTDAMSKTVAWLGRGGTTFPQNVATTPSCGPSRGALFSGRYAHSVGVRHQGDIGNFDHNKSLQHDLHGAGYASAAVGKIFNQWDEERTPPYFDYSALTGGGHVRANFVVDGKPRQAPYSTTFIGEQVNRYVDRFDGDDDAQPWFIYAGFTAPHPPYMPEAKYANRSFPWSGDPATKETDRSDKPAYVRQDAATEQDGIATRQAQLRMLLSVDDAIDSVRQHLADRGELDNTLVILASDNGRMWGEHGLIQKFTPYLPAEQVPLLLWWPGHVPTGATDNRLSALIDIAPTVLDAARVRPSYQPEGHSLLYAWSRQRILLEYWLDRSNGGFPSWASTYRPGQSQFTEYYTSGGGVLDREYYDLARDPWQLRNLLSDGDPTNDPPIGPLSTILNEDRRCVGGNCP